MHSATTLETTSFFKPKEESQHGFFVRHLKECHSKKHKDYIFNTFINTIQFPSYASTFYKLQELTNIFPEHLETIFQLVEKHNLFQKYFRQTQKAFTRLEILFTLFPNHAQDILERIVQSEEMFLLFAPDLQHLQMLVNTFPKEKEKIYQAVVNHGISNNYLHGHTLEFVRLKSLFWNHSAELRQINNNIAKPKVTL